MYIKLKDFIGKLEYYEIKEDNPDMVKIRIKADDGDTIAGICKESDITIPNIMANSRILYDIDKQREELEGEWMRDYSNRKIDYENRKPKPINYDTILQIRINKDIKDKLYKLAEEKHIPISEIVRSALETHIKKLQRSNIDTP